MAKKKSFKKALVMTILSMVGCLSMFAGTTFAWFTDSVTSTENIIKAGNLDIELYYDNDAEKENWQVFDENKNVFIENALWEPGHTEVIKFKIKNAGSLALKYQFKTYIDTETESINVNGDKFKLSDFIKYAVVEGDHDYDRDSAVKAVDADAVALNQTYSSSLKLNAGEERIVTMVVYMPTTVENDANAKKDAPVPQINLGIALNATQLEAENDSFGPDYDASAPWLGAIDTAWYFDDTTATSYTIDSAEELAGLAAIVNGTAQAPATGASTISDSTSVVNDTFNGKTVKLGGNINLNDMAWTPIGRIGTTSTDFTYAFRGTFDGQGYTVSNFNVSNLGWAGLFGLAYKANIKNVNANNVTLNSSRMTGAIVGQLYGSIDNCHVNGVDITVVPNAVVNGYDNGDKVGGIVGWLGDNGNNHHITKSSATDVNITGYRDIGGIVGYVAWSTTISDCSVKDAVLTSDQTKNSYGEKDANVGAIWGRKSGDIIESNNTSENVTASYAQGGIQYLKDGEGNVMLYNVPSDYKKDTVVVPEGVNAIGNFAFANNQNVKTVELSSTVRTLGRGFDESTVEKVVLNEGLEVIDSRAFKSTTALKEVVISSTVKEIADNAFQKSGIKTITIPANVKTVGETAFGASLIETVIFEGDIDVQGYAFRGCSKLRTVYFKGDVNFVASTLNGRNSTWFCNGESNNPNTSNITFYVQTEDIKEKVLTAMGAERNNTPVILMNVVDKSEDLADSFVNGNGADTVYVSAGTYTFPSSSISAGDVIICDKDTVFEGTSSLNINGATIKGGNFVNDSGYAVSGTINGNFQNCVFEASEALRWCYTNEGDTIVFENCVFKTDFRGIHFDGMHGDVIFRNCEINGFNAYSGNGSMTFENCTFGYDESYYNGLNIYTNTVIKNSTFNFKSGKTNFIDMEGTGKTLSIEGCVAYMDGAEANVLDFVGGSKLAQNTVIFNGTTQAKAGTQEELNSALTGKADVTLSEGNYTLPSVSSGTVSITGTKNTVITVTKPNYSGSDVTLTGVTVKGSGYSTGVQHVNTVTYNDVTIVGDMCLYGEKVVFNKCTFELSKGQYIWTYGAKEVEFIDCTFNTAGKAILIYNEGAGASKVTVKGCTFNSTAGDKAGAIANQNCAAIEIDNFTGLAHSLTTEGNIYSDNFSGEWRIKNYVSGNAITVNGVAYNQIAIDGKLMTKDSLNNVTVQE
ncbi:MAG: hypothetical protein E7353_02730 [Clostridiales bacterium]|nr:hypothetical protein [Clostridiales bacterium]